MNDFKEDTNKHMNEEKNLDETFNKSRGFGKQNSEILKRKIQ